MINESEVYFYPGGGHSHDSENSSLIKTSVYSVFDFPFTTVGDPARVADQIRNLDGFKQLIIDTVNQSIIAPSGIVFQQGMINGSAHIISRSIATDSIATDAITANEIAAGTITADLLAANIVLVNNIISSGNYVSGTSGWSINSNGTAEFDQTMIRGTLQADTVFINNDNYWTSAGVFSVGAANNTLFFNGSVLELTGKVTATSGQIAGWEIDGDNLTTGGNFDGDMEIGEMADGFAGMRVAGEAISGYYPEVFIANGEIQLYVTDGTNSTSIASYTSEEAVINSNAGTTSYTGAGVIYNNYSGTQNWEFHKSGNDLFAIVDGVAYCLEQCGNSPTTTTTTTPAPGGGGGTTTTTTTAAPNCGNPPGNGWTESGGVYYQGPNDGGAACGPGYQSAWQNYTKAGCSAFGLFIGCVEVQTTASTAATTTATTTTTTVTTNPPDPACVCCIGTAVSEQRCINVPQGNILQQRDGTSYNGTCGASGPGGTNCSGACTGCGCPTFTDWGSYYNIGYC